MKIHKVIDILGGSSWRLIDMSRCDDSSLMFEIVGNATKSNVHFG